MNKVDDVRRIDWPRSRWLDEVKGNFLECGQCVQEGVCAFGA